MPYFEIVVGVNDAVVAQPNPSRRLIIVSNPSPVDVYVAFDRPAVVGQSIKLPAGSAPLDLTDSYPGLVGGAVHAVAAGAGGRLAGFVDQ